MPDDGSSWLRSRLVLPASLPLPALGDKLSVAKVAELVVIERVSGEMLPVEEALWTLEGDAGPRLVAPEERPVPPAPSLLVLAGIPFLELLDTSVTPLDPYPLPVAWMVCEEEIELSMFEPTLFPGVGFEPAVAVLVDV